MELIKHPDTFLRGETLEIEFPLSEENKIIIKNLTNLMYQKNGIGLAANQAGYNRKIFVMDVSNEKNDPKIFINPVITSKNNVQVKRLKLVDLFQLI